jgi:hypothetical protein
MTYRSLIAAGIGLMLAFVATAPATAAPVAPRNCGKIMDQRYRVKADQVKCWKARKRSKRYIRTGWRPDGYSCTSYDSSTSLRFRCTKGVRTYFAIRL